MVPAPLTGPFSQSLFSLNVPLDAKLITVVNNLQILLNNSRLPFLV